MAQLFKEMVALLGCSNDDFIRTTDARHKHTVSELWKRIEAAGDIYLSNYSGWYSVRDEAFYGADEIEDRDGQKFSTKTGTPVEWVEEASYFFKLSAYQDKLLKLYADQPDFIGPAERRNEVVSFVKGGLQDLSISRTTFDWGIPVPGAQGHIMYVWVDALTNYLSGHRLAGQEPAQPLLAGRRPYHRQGHRALPCHLLAGLPDVGGVAAAQARLRPWLPVQPR